MNNKSKEKRMAARNRVAAGKQPVGVLPPTSKKGFESFAGFVTKRNQLINNQIIRTMKNIRFIAVIALMMMGGMTMKAQDYHPIVEDGKQRNVLFSYPWNPPEPQHRYTDIYKIEGDTLLDGVSYKVMYATRNEDLTGWNLWGFLRETEDGQVFSRRPSTSDEQLLYDFSMEVGDTICMCDYGYDECCMVVIEKGETIVNGEPRQQIVLEYPFGNGEEEVWIEGIGSLYGIVDSGSLFLTGGSTNLLCYYEDGDLIWNNNTPGYDRCYIAQGDLVITPGSLTFDEVAVSQTLTISNHYDVTVTITDINVEPDDNIVLVSHTNLPRTLQPNESMEVEVELNTAGNKGYNTYYINVVTSIGTRRVMVRVNENAWNEYMPLVQEANNRQKWNVVYIASNENYPNDYHTEIQSIRDNINLDGLDYKLVWKEDVYDSKRIAGAVREEDKRVYYRMYWQQSYQNEVLLYDFNLTVGDTVSAGWSDYRLIVLEESQVQVNGTMRRQLGLAMYFDDGTTGEVEEYWIEGVGSTYGFLNSGYEGWVGAFVHLLCYHENGNLIWDNEEFDDCVMNSDGAPATFAPQGAEWYFNLSSFMGSPFSYSHMEVLGDTIIQGHDCSVITQQFLGGNGQEQYVYEDNGKVHWYNQTLGRFTTLYDFDAEVGESWTCEIDSCAYEVTVTEITYYEGLDQNHQFRAQRVSYNGELGYFGGGTIIDGIGEISGLFPYPYACAGDIYDGPYPDWLRCYLVDGEMLYHGGDYECDEIVDVPYPSYPFAVGDLLYTIISDNPPQVSVYGHVNGDYAQGELDIPSTVTCEDVTYTVTEIGEWAFKNCTGLTGQLYFPSTIDTIQEGAFYGCSGFTGTLDLSFTTAVLKKDVFRECSGFTELILPLFITEIPEGAFCGCSGLTGTLVLSESESLEIIGEGAFARCSGFTGLVLPNGLREIREQAFAGCTGFTGNLVIPETVTHIKYQAFGHCTGFSGDLVIPNSVVELGNTQNSSYYVNPEPYSTFADCFDHLVLSQSLDTIGPRCFAGCTRLTGDLVMPEGLKAVFSYAFEGCTGLTGLTLNDSLAVIGSYAFSGCSGIRGIVTIPENVGVGMAAFEWCSGIEELVLPHHIVFQSNPDKGYVFQGCTSLTELDIPEGWTRIEKSSFAMCSNLLSVHLPESLMIIDGSSFSECTSLSEINIPEGVTEIGIGAFSKCSSLTHVELPASLRTLGGQSFADCTSLSGILVVPDLVQRIEMMTFRSCNQLDCIVLGDSINYIAEPAFQDTELDSLVIKAMTPPELRRMTNQGAWHFPDDLSIVVPCGTLEAYHNAEGWSDFTSITEDCGSGLIEFEGSEWYYEIQNENGNITYQHLEYAADTTINHKEVVIIIRTNTLYDKGEHQDVTHEYLYEEDNVVYWWNKDLQEFTVLYDFGASQGDEWEIKVGMETLTMHVDAVDYYNYDGQWLKMLRVSDDGDLFGGNIVYGVGHLSSFFPEQLMTRGKGYGVTGLRCYWNDGNLLFTVSRNDCDAIYAEWHNGIEEQETDENQFDIYPNPTNGVLFVETHGRASLQAETYRITNLMGQTLMSGTITVETQQINVAELPEGMYFISVGKGARKFVVGE